MTATDQTSETGQMLAKAETLIEALPYFQRYAGRSFVVKYGGHAMGDPEAAQDFAEDIVLLKAVGINPIVVHGGGPQIGAMLKKLGVESRFVDGLRVTDKETAEVAEMVLSGAINKELVGWIAQAGGKAIGLSGKDGGLVTASKVTRTTKDPDSQIEQAVDLGFVGEPEVVDTSILDTLCQAGMIPIALPPAWAIQPTSSLLIAPERTISATWAVSLSVTLRPSTKRDSTPSFLSIAPICGPPPWTTIGLMPTALSRTMSCAKSCAASGSPIAWPPYFTTKLRPA